MGLTDNCMKFSIVIINVICGILGALVFALAVWMRLENEVRDWVRELDMTQYWNGLYILMAAGAIIVIVSLCGCCGALMEHPCLLATAGTITTFTFVLLMFGSTILLAKYIRPSFDKEHIKNQFDTIFSIQDSRKTRLLIFLYYYSAALVFVALILELAGAIYILINGTQTSQITPWLENRFTRLIVDSNYNPAANRILQVVQEKVGCCGARNYQDYDRNRLPISDFCRDVVSGNVYQQGCVEKFSQFIEKRTGWIAGISIFIAAMQVLLLCLTFCFWRSMRGNEYDDEGIERRKPYTGVATDDY